MRRAKAALRTCNELRAVDSANYSTANSHRPFQSNSPLQPLPRISNLHLQARTSRVPAKERTRATGVSNQHRGIARPAPSYFRWDGAAANRFGRCNHFFHRITARIGEIKGAAVSSVEKIFERLHMRRGNVTHMDVVTHTAAIWRIVVAAENTYR